MHRRSSLVVLAILGGAVFLAGLELMVTAVALPSIVVDLADWTALRSASWIVNGYLLTSIVVMPLAGRLADRWGARRLFLFALTTFTIGSVLAGRAQSLEELIAGRIVQAVGGGVIVPIATSAASHLFDGHARPRALGVIGGLTFLGMAAGPFVGAAIIGSIHPDTALEALRIDGPLRDVLDAPWRYVFYVNLPIAIVLLVTAWAAPPRWEATRASGPIDLLGAATFSLGLAAILLGLTLAGSDRIAGIDADPALVVGALMAFGVIALVAAVVRGLGRGDAFLDPRWFRSIPFSSAALVSLLTGYAFATAIIGGAVFVDRVLYGGPDVQRLALGSLAGATAIGALVSGLALRVAGLRLTTAVGLALAIAALVEMSGWSPATQLGEVALALAVFGLGFGLTVTPRSTAAVEALGRAAFGIASATVTVARMIGMAIGLAVLTAFGSTVIDRLWRQIYATPDAYKAFIPAVLRDRPLKDGLVVQALEDWASGEAARILVGIFLVAAAVTAVAIVPALALGRAAAGERARSQVPPADGAAVDGQAGDAEEDRAAVAL